MPQYEVLSIFLLFYLAIPLLHSHKLVIMLEIQGEASIITSNN
jgi:hypothetical protein